MWTDADRNTYRQAGDRLPSDLSDPEWERLARLIPPAKPGGRPRKTDMRAAMNAILYLLRTGCPWRYLPRGIFPPRSTVYNIFRAFQRDGVWEAIWEELRAALRERLGREASPSAGVIDSCSLKSAEKGDARKVKQTQWAMTPARGRRDARSTLWSTPRACPCEWWFTPPPSRIEMARPWSSIASASASIGWRSSGPMAATTPAKSNSLSPRSRRCASRSSNVPTTVPDSSSCRAAGSPNGLSHGSAATAASPRT